LGDKADLGVGLLAGFFLEVVLANLKGFNVGPLGGGVNDVFFQL
jgi:hypothetical protein